MVVWRTQGKCSAETAAVLASCGKKQHGGGGGDGDLEEDGIFPTRLFTHKHSLDAVSLPPRRLRSLCVVAASRCRCILDHIGAEYYIVAGQ